MKKLLILFTLWHHVLFAQKHDTVLINQYLAIPDTYFSTDTSERNANNGLLFSHLLYTFKDSSYIYLYHRPPYFLVYKKKFSYNPSLFKSGIFYIYQNLPDGLRKQYNIGKDTCNAEILFPTRCNSRLYPMSEEIINNLHGYTSFWHYQVKMKCIRVGETSISIFNEHYNPKCKKSKKWLNLIVPQYYIVKILYFRPLYPKKYMVEYYKDEYKGEYDCN